MEVKVVCTWAVCLLAVCTATSRWRFNPSNRVGVMDPVTQEPVKKEPTTETEVTAAVEADGSTRCVDPLMVKDTNSSEESLIKEVEAHAGFDLIINKTCPITQRTYLLGEPINKRSMCPWHYRKDDGKLDRIPQFLYHAVCNCTNCQMLHAESAVCTPIITSIPVLYREACSDGVYKYTRTQEQISVACVCSHSSGS
ncbi:Interleukin-25 [Holothuria leucospilota]|uniref:Interleukin-25 n=1 Tax=Holothuria leucospilota TaxID=206669 RepID=A0A9Q1HII6_HOLLE|nr:Interleukin-25 [Holothuria leucospilota]